MGERTPILILCEGSYQRTHNIDCWNGLCAMCGLVVPICGDAGEAVAHDREDILAEIDRGDFG